jgi:4a-hydroxytetrahydrobiopterin dehydratase
MSPQLLSEEDIKKLLQAYPLWELSNGTFLTCIIKDRNYQNLVDLVLKISEIAEEMNHHPDIIFSWGKLQIDITTHESGGITLRDQLFIKKLEKIFNQSEIFLS